MSRLRQTLSRQLLRWRTSLRASCSQTHDDSGSAVIELAFTLSILGLPLLMGMAYYGTLLTNDIVISSAAHAGAAYGMQSSSYAADTSYIIAAAQDDSGMGTNLTVTPTIYYACSNSENGTHYATSALGAAGCTGGNNHSLKFIQVVASAPVTPALKFPGQPATVTLSSTSVMEVEE